MTIIEAIKSGKAMKRSFWKNFYLSCGNKPWPESNSEGRMKSKHKKEHLTAIAEAIKSALLDVNDELAIFEKQIELLQKGLS